MGNCQAIDAATLVIQHPSGKVERFYSTMSASHVMKTNPGHYVALFISTTTLSSTRKDQGNGGNCNNKSVKNSDSTNPVRLTRIKLLKPTDTLLLGHVYRLITTQEVMKGLRERKQAKVKQNMSESGHKPDCVKEKLEKPTRRSDPEGNQVTKPERHRTRTTTASKNNNNNNNNNNNVGGVGSGSGSATAKTRFWQPSLQSISEFAS